MTDGDVWRHACTFLFVPATQPERLQKALASGADLVIADWEDAVAPADKPQARAALAQALLALPAAARARVLVRINAVGTPWHGEDVRALAQLVAQGAAGAVVPKAEGAQVLRDVAQAAGARCALLALVESVAGLDALDAIATAPQVQRLAFGHLDFQVDAGMCCGADESELLPARMAIVMASRRARLAPPVDGVTVDTRDTQRIASDAARAMRMGYGAKLCIHPRQVAPIHSALAPSPQALDWARRVLAADAASPGAARLDGRMIDRPVVLQAQRTLQRSDAATLGTRRPEGG